MTHKEYKSEYNRLHESEYKKHPGVFWFIGLVLLYIIYQGYQIWRRTKQQNENVLKRKYTYPRDYDDESSLQIGFRKYRDDKTS